MKPKVINGKKYKNDHTQRICEVTQINFNSVGHLLEGDPRNLYPHYTHYQTFRKDWTVIDDGRE